MPEVYCERQIDKGLRLIVKEGASKCKGCVPDFLAQEIMFPMVSVLVISIMLVLRLRVLLRL